MKAVVARLDQTLWSAAELMMLTEAANCCIAGKNADADAANICWHTAKHDDSYVALSTDGLKWGLNNLTTFEQPVACPVMLQITGHAPQQCPCSLARSCVTRAQQRMD